MKQIPRKDYVISQLDTLSDVSMDGLSVWPFATLNAWPSNNHSNGPGAADLQFFTPSHPANCDKMFLLVMLKIGMLEKNEEKIINE